MAKRKSKAPVEVVESVENELFKNVRAILSKARAAVYTAANTAMVEAYWNVGREIVEKQGGASRAKYGEGLISAIALRLTTEFGDGFTVPNLRNMRQFYLTFPKRYALRSELSWTHYRILMRVESDEARDYYFNECADARWSTRILQRQIDTQFYERLVRNHSPVAARSLVKRDGTWTRLLPRGGTEEAQHRRCDLQIAVKYHLSLPTVQELQQELKRERAAIEEAMQLLGHGQKGNLKP